MSIRHTVYMRLGQSITLAFVTCIADQHPEVHDTAPPLPPEPNPKAERGPQLTESFIRKVLGKPRRPTAQQAQSELHRLRIMRRIEWRGF